MEGLGRSRSMHATCDACKASPRAFTCEGMSIASVQKR